MSNHVIQVAFKTKRHCFPEGWRFSPKEGINLIVGDQGCGKSTLLNAMGTNQADIVEITLSEPHNTVETMYLDTEKHNPRTVAHLDMTHLPTHVVLGSKFRSHGESILPLVVSCKKAQNSILFLDEPEAGLSIRSQWEVAAAIQTAAQQGCQLFVATHSAILIEQEPEVFSLEHNRWMNPKDFLETQKIPRPTKEPKAAKAAKAEENLQEPQKPLKPWEKTRSRLVSLYHRPLSRD